MSALTDLLSGLLKSSEVQGLIQKGLSDLVDSLLHPKPKTPSAPVDKPIPNPNNNSDFPDDIIPAPTPGRVVTSLVLSVSRIQLSKQRFPEAYTSENPFGLFPKDGVEGGTKAIPYGSKLWLTLTARDAAGKEFLREDILAHNLAYKTTYQEAGAYIKGHGAAPDGSMNPGYEVVDADGIGNGITAYQTQNGFLHQIKLYSEGTFECSGALDGMASNKFTIRVS